MLVALGMTLVISSGGIDISVGAIMAVSAAVLARCYTADLGWAASVGCGILVSTAASAAFDETLLLQGFNRSFKG